MTKSLTFVVLVALVLGLVGCASDPPKQSSGVSYVASPDNGADYGSWTMPIHFLE
ncbi:MAG: hypothetical protein KGJ66_12610 [Alphaproteobacteria bacterium]|nr:hypothetical protein [Alphaproteobacteria bacterium]